MAGAYNQLHTMLLTVAGYIAEQIGALLAHDAFAYAVQSTARGDQEREALIFRRLEAVCRAGK